MALIKEIHFWRGPEAPGLETCRVRGSRHAFPNHAHDGIYAVGLMDSGASYCLGPEKSDSLIASGELVLINPGQVHSGVPAKGTSINYRMLYVSAPWLRRAAEDVLERDSDFPEFATFVTRNPSLYGQLSSLESLAGQAGRLEFESIMVEVFSRLLETYGGVRPAAGPGREPRAIRIAKERLASDLAEKMSLEDVAGAAGLSRYHFLRVFKRATGLSPHRFRTQRRVDRAKHLLKKGAPFTQVALETGFTDQSHFCNTFKQYTAATPGQYLAG